MCSSHFFRKKSPDNITISANTNPFSAKRNFFDSASLYAAFLIGPSFTFPAVGMVMELVKDREVSILDSLLFVSLNATHNNIFF